MPDTPNGAVETWLAQFDAALRSRDIEAALALFDDESYWRDFVSFTWNLKTMEGKDEVRASEIYADDAVVVALALRSVVRHAGAEALTRHWPGSPEGLAVVRRLAGLPAREDGYPPGC